MAALRRDELRRAALRQGKARNGVRRTYGNCKGTLRGLQDGFRTLNGRLENALSLTMGPPWTAIASTSKRRLARIRKRAGAGRRLRRRARGRCQHDPV